MSRHTENKEEILKIHGEIKVIHNKLDNHITHLAAKIDTIFKIVWVVSFMALGNHMMLVRARLIP